MAKGLFGAGGPRPSDDDFYDDDAELEAELDALYGRPDEAVAPAAPAAEPEPEPEPVEEDRLDEPDWAYSDEALGASVFGLDPGVDDDDWDQDVPEQEARASSGRFDLSRLDEVAAQIAERQREEDSDRPATLDVAKMSKQEKKDFVAALGDRLELYDHLLAIKPREGYLFKSDYYKVDAAGRVACILAYFHRDEANDEFGFFWGINRIPVDLPDGVVAISFEQVAKKEEKWVEDQLKKADKLDRLEAREQNEGGTMGTKRRAAKVADDMFAVVSEIQDGAAYLSVQDRLLLHAPDLESLDLALERIKRQYVDAFATVHSAAYHGEQRQELTNLFGPNEDKRGDGFHFTSTEFAGSYSLVTNGLADPAGEYVGHMRGDVNSSAILFEVDRWRHHVVLSDETLNRALGRERVVDMWGSKISQAALLENHRVIHLVLNGADLDKLGPRLESMTARLDMTSGEVNMFELFGDVADELSLFSTHIEKLVLMTEQAYEGGEAESMGLINTELRELLNTFYVDQRMWANAAEKNRDRLRLVGLPHGEVPLLQVFVSYLDTRYKSLLHAKNKDEKVQTAIRTLLGVFRNLLANNSDLFNQHTSDNIDSAVSARRVIYDFSGLVHRGQGLAMAQLVNVVGFAVSSLQEGDVLIIHGADVIVDGKVQKYLKGQFERLYRRGARVAYLYDKPDSMLENQDFNRFERADYTILGPMSKETIAEYENRMRTAIPSELKAILTYQDSNLSYLRRDAVNVVFMTDLSLGLRKKGPGLRNRGGGTVDGSVVDARGEVAGEVAEAARAKRVAEGATAEAEVVARSERELASRKEALLARPGAADGDRTKAGARR